MASTSANDKTSKVVSLLFLVAILVVFYIISPLFLPVWRWQHRPLEKVSEEQNIPLELLVERPYDLRYNPRAKGDPLPWQIMVHTASEAPEWAKTPDGEPIDEYKMLVRVDMINDRTGKKPNENFLGGTQYDKLYRVRGWRLPAGSLGREHSRPILLYQGSTFEKVPIGEAKSIGPQLKLDLRKGDWITDDDPEMGFEYRRDPFGDRLLYGPTEEELEAEEAEAATEGTEGEEAAEAE